MASLSAGHTVVGAFLIPAAITQIINNGTWVMGPGLCMTKNVVEAVTVAACMYHVIVMALDMYVAICKPLLYRKLTARSSHLMILLCWLVPTAVFVVPIGVRLAPEREGTHYFVPSFTTDCPKTLLSRNLQRTQSTPKSKSKIFTTAYSAGMTEIPHAASDDGQDIDTACRNERSDDIKRIKPPKEGSDAIRRQIKY
ncbi:hypothetical protein Btru_076843 [Bulinus truncatus]|nr:hypothetical protein Btru_076843 [Bulinus truncatus]